MSVVRRLLAASSGQTLPVARPIVSRIALYVKIKAVTFFGPKLAFKRLTYERQEDDRSPDLAWRHLGYYERHQNRFMTLGLSEELVVKALSHAQLSDTTYAGSPLWTDLSKLAGMDRPPLPADMPEVSRTRDIDSCIIEWFDKHVDQTSPDVSIARTFMALMHERCSIMYDSAPSRLVDAAKRWSVSERVLAFFWSQDLDLMALAENDYNTYRLLCFFILLEGKRDILLGYIAGSHKNHPTSSMRNRRSAQASLMMYQLIKTQLIMPHGLVESLNLYDDACNRLGDALRRGQIFESQQSNILRSSLPSIISKMRIRNHETKTIPRSIYKRFVINARTAPYSDNYGALLSLLHPTKPLPYRLIRHLALIDSQSFEAFTTRRKQLLKMSALALIRYSLEHEDYPNAAYGVLFLYRYFKTELDDVVQLPFAEDTLENDKPLATPEPTSESMDTESEHVQPGTPKLTSDYLRSRRKSPIKVNPKTGTMTLTLGRISRSKA